MEGHLYRAVWRWHFYAGLIVLPVLAWLAVTGGLYLYKPEIEAAVYGDWLKASAPGTPLLLGELTRAIEHQSRGKVTQLTAPAETGRSWQATVQVPGGERLTAFVDPGDGRMLGLIAQGGVMKTVRDLHSLIITGPVGNALVEIVAGWAMLLSLSGFYLWWPRGANRALALRGRPGQRRFWRDFHASTGAIAGLILLFLAITGMPWSGVWGKTVQGLVAANGLGRPKSPGPAPWEAAKGGHDMHGGRETLPWSRQAMPAPVGHHASDIGPQRVAEIAAGMGLSPPLTMTFPADAEAPWLVSRTIVRAGDARALYIDAADGAVLQDARFAAFGGGAKAIEWGIAVHQGQEYGEPNRLLMLAGCIGVLLLAISAPVLWWKRRIGGRLAQPPRADRRTARGVAALMLVVGAIFPLTGATMVVALTGEWLAGRMRSRLSIG